MTEAQGWRWLAKRLGTAAVAHQRYVCHAIDYPLALRPLREQMHARIRSYLERPDCAWWAEGDDVVPDGEEYFTPKRMACIWLALDAEAEA